MGVTFGWELNFWFRADSCWKQSLCSLEGKGDPLVSVPNPTEVVTVQKLSEMVIFYKSMIYVGLKMRELTYHILTNP